MKTRILSVFVLLCTLATATAQVPANDLFASATALSGISGSVAGNNTNASATNQAGEPATTAGFTSRRTLWYTWQATSSANVVFTVAGPTLDSQIAVYTGSAVNSLSVVRASDFNGAGVSDAVTFTPTVGVTYRICIAGFLDSAGTFTLSWVSNTGRFTVLDANVAENVPGGQVTVTVTRSGTTSGTATVDYETLADVATDGEDYAGVSGALSFANGEASKTFNILITDDAILEGPEHFYVLLSNPSAGATIDVDTALVTIADNEHPANDDFANAEEISGTQGTAPGTDLNASEEGSESVPSVWYRWTAPASASPRPYLFTTTSQFITPQLEVFTGASLNALVAVPTIPTGNGFRFDAIGGTTYHFRVTDLFGDQGAFSLQWKLFPGQFRVGDYTVAEEGGSVQITILREFGSAGPYTIGIFLEEFSAKAGLDFVEPAVTEFIFADGEVSKSFTIDIVNDTLLEGREQFQVTLTGANPDDVISPDSTGIVSIIDNEHPANDTFASAVVIGGDTGTIQSTNLGATRKTGEFFGDGSVWFKWTAPTKGYFRFSLRGNIAEGFIDVFTGTTLANLQLATSGETATFAAEVNEVRYIRVRGGTPFDEANFSLHWEELPGTFSIESTTVSEAAGQVILTISRKNGDKGAFTFNYATADKNAESPSDYSSGSGSVSFSDGEVTKTISVGIVQDTELEGSEAFYVQLSGGGATFSQSLAYVSIQDDEHPANDNLANAILISGAQGTVDGTALNATMEPGEPLGLNTVWYRWTAPTSGFYTFNLPIEVFTGASFANLSTVSSSSTFAAIAGTEYRIRLAKLFSDFTLSWAIASGTFSLVVPASVSEGAGTLTVTVIRESGSAGAVDPSYSVNALSATGGSDFIETSGALHFADGETSKTFTVTILQDSAIEAAEAFIIGISIPGQGARQAFVQITDDDHPANDGFAAAAEITGTTGTATVNLNNASRETGEPNNFSYQTGTVWYRWTATGSGAVRFTNTAFAGMAAYTGNALNGLTLVALDQTGQGMTFAVTAGTVYQIAVGSGTDPNFDLLWAFSAGGAFEIASGFSSSDDLGGYAGVNETATQLIFTVKRTGGTGTASLPFRLEDDLTNKGDDYTDVSGTLDFAAGEVLKTITIPITNDTELEGDESFSLILGTPVPDALLANVTSVYITINDDEDDPVNDNFADAIALDPSVDVVIGNNEGASGETGEPQHFDLLGDEDGRTIWYSFTAPANGLLELGGYSFQNDDPAHTHAIIIAVYTGSSLQTLQRVNSGFGESEYIQVDTTAGTKYYIALETDRSVEFNHTQGVSLNYIFSGNGNSGLGPTFSAFQVDVAREGIDANAQVTIERIGNTTGTDTVRVSTFEDSASPFTDYIPLNVTVTFAPGEADKTVAFPVLNDGDNEGFENFYVQIEDLFGNPVADTIVLIDDDDDNPANDGFANATLLAGAVGLTTGTTSGAGSEAAEPIANRLMPVWYRWTAPATGVARFFVDGDHITAAYSGNVLQSLNLVASGTDGVAFGTLAGRTYYIAVSSDFDEDFTLSFVSDGTQSVIGFKSQFVEVDEAAGTASVTVTRVGNLSSAATVLFSTQSSAAFPNGFGSNGAFAGLDYTATAGTLSFAPGESVKNIAVPILNDTDLEDYESFALVLVTPSGALLGANYAALVTIFEDDDDPANDEFSGAIVLEGDSGSIQGFNYGAENDPLIPLDSYARDVLSGVWYRWVAPVTGRASFFFSSSDNPIYFEVYRGTSLDALSYVGSSYDASFDTIAGKGYVILVQCDPSFGDSAEFVLDWTSESLPTVNFASASVSVDEDAGTASLTINLSMAATGEVQVGYYTYDDEAEAGDDYTDVDDVVTFAAGETTKTITVPVLGDTNFEGNETFHVLLWDINGPAVSGSVDSATVTIVDDETLLPFKTTFTGLVQGDDFAHASNGSVSLALTAKGTFSGKLMWSGKQYSFKGKFDTHGLADVSIARRKLPPIILHFAVAQGGTQISGTVTEGAMTSTLDGDKLSFSKTALYSGQGDYYSVLFPAAPPVQGEVAARPAGHGYAKMNVSKLGLAKFAGVLADGSKVSLGVQVSQEDEVPVYLPLYKGVGVLIGKLIIEENPGVSDAAGSLEWFKPAGLAKQKVFPNGINESVDAIASRYVNTKGQRVLLAQDGNGVLLAGAGGLIPGVSQIFDLATTNRVTLTASPSGSTKLSIAAKSGLFKGSFISAGQKKAVPFNGVLFQKQNFGGGYFLNADPTGVLQSGFVEIVAENP